MSLDDNHKNLYENPLWQEIDSSFLHPGGIDSTKELLAAADLASHSKILDLGCGRGCTVQWLMENTSYSPYGLDISSALLAGSGNLYEICHFKQGSCHNMPYDDDFFDALLCECSFSLFQPHEMALQEMKRVLKPNGQVIISDFYFLDRQGEISWPLNTCLKGALTYDGWQSLFQVNNFHNLLFLDKNQLYKRLLVDIIMKFGSLNAFWQAINEDSCPNCLGESLFRGSYKLSYFHGIWQIDQ
ncbi:MAG: class I SAM-dependent methyltransferase [Clostridiales bacterium]